MKEHRFTRYALYGSLYFVQGAIMSYFTALNSLYLMSFSINMTQIGIMSGIAMIPFIIKIFLGMISDRFNLLGFGHRKPYIFLGLILQAGCLFAIPFINPGQYFWAYAVLGFSMMTGMAFYDTCTDGLALDSTSESEQGTVQSIMVGGRALGVVILSAVIGTIAHAASWTAAFWTLAVITLLPMPLVFFVPEPSRRSDQQFEWAAFSSFRQPRVLMLGIFGALYSLIIYGANEIVNPFLQNTFGISVSMAGYITTVWGIGVILGGLVAGRFADRFGHLRATQWGAVASLVTVGALALIVAPWLAWPLVLIFGLAFGFYETVYFALSMEITDPRIAASMYSILMAIANVGTGIGLALTGTLADAIGYPMTFLLLAALNILVYPLSRAIFPQKAPIPDTTSV